MHLHISKEGSEYLCGRIGTREHEAISPLAMGVFDNHGERRAGKFKEAAALQLSIRRKSKRGLVLHLWILAKVCDSAAGRLKYMK